MKDNIQLIHDHTKHPAEMITISIVDDHILFANGVKSFLDNEDNIRVIWTANSAASAFTYLGRQIPDIILMDISLGEDNGIALTKSILEQFSKVKIIALSMHTDDHYIIKIIESGASGYLVKDGGGLELIDAINAVSNGGVYYSQQVSHSISKYYLSGQILYL